MDEVRSTHLDLLFGTKHSRQAALVCEVAPRTSPGTGYKIQEQNSGYKACSSHSPTGGRGSEGRSERSLEGPRDRPLLSKKGTGSS